MSAVYDIATERAYQNRLAEMDRFACARIRAHRELSRDLLLALDGERGVVPRVVYLNGHCVESTQPAVYAVVNALDNMVCAGLLMQALRTSTDPVVIELRNALAEQYASEFEDDIAEARTA